MPYIPQKDPVRPELTRQQKQQEMVQNLDDAMLYCAKDSVCTIVYTCDQISRSLIIILTQVALPHPSCWAGVPPQSARTTATPAANKTNDYN